MSNGITFSGEAEKAIELIKNPRKNIFITGKAGTGKSTLLEHIRMLPSKKMVVLAPTGIAAINVKGETIHSFFKLKPGYEKDEASNMRMDKRKMKAYQSIETILVDEISMVRADILDAMDIFLRRSREIDEPFGGVQMIFFGDLFQLPPVVSNQDKDRFFQSYKSPYFFDAEVFNPQDLFSEPFQMEKVELTQIYRQTDNEFIQVLNAIRDNSAQPKDLAFLNQYVQPNYVPKNEDSCVYLMATNSQAMSLNTMKLNQIEGELIDFKALKKGKIGNLQPNDMDISVKIGAQVMFINNDFKRRWVNGTIGKIVKYGKKYDEESDALIDMLKVELENGKTVDVKRHTWDISKYAFKEGKFVREEIGSFTQVPLKLAWAITIHKSQGKTFNKVVIDLGRGSFAHGQTYVALSRCTGLDGLILKNPLRSSDIIVDPAVRMFATT